jgi:hypothetical protein
MGDRIVERKNGQALIGKTRNAKLTPHASTLDDSGFNDSASYDSAA